LLCGRPAIGGILAIVSSMTARRGRRQWRRPGCAKCWWRITPLN